MESNRTLAICIALGTTVCLIVTSLMTRQAGISQAATIEGQFLLGWAVIAVHLTGLPGFGIASGILIRRGNYIFGTITFLVVMATAIFSVMNIMSFVASERLTISKARESQEKARTDLQKAQFDAAKKQQDVQSELAKTQLQWLQRTSRDSDGRRERKEMAEQGTKLVTEFGKAQMAMPTDTNVTAPVIIQRPDGGAELIAEFTGWKLPSIQLSQMVYLAILLVILETFGWPLFSYLWTRDGAAPVPVMALEPIIEPPPLPRSAAPRLLPAPAPKAANDVKPEKPITLRAHPDTDWRTLLDRMDFPPAGSRHKGALRAKHSADTAALRFLAWLGAYKESGEFHNVDLDRLYSEFAQADHREETGLRVVKASLEAMRGKVASKRFVPTQGTLWLITPPPLDRITALLDKAQALETPPGVATEPAAPHPTPAVEAAPSSQEGSEQKSAASILPFGVAASLAAFTRGADWEKGQWAIGRLRKAAFQNRLESRDRKQSNRLRLSRTT